MALALGFCPDMNLKKFESIKDVHLFVKKLSLKTLFHKQVTPNTGMEVLHSLFKSECRASKELLEMEDDFSNTPGLSTPPEPDLIDLIDLETYLQPDLDLKPNLIQIKKKSKTCPSPTKNKNANLFLTQVTREIEQLALSNETSTNISSKQQIALEHLKEIKANYYQTI